MTKESNGTITSSQLSCIIILVILGTEVLFLPNFIIQNGKQDAWICTIFGGVYPVFIVLIANFMCKRFPEYNILKLSKKFFGKFLGSILNVLFLVQFIVYSAERCAQLGNLARLFTNYYSTQRAILVIIIIAVVYSTYNGVNALARASEFIFYFTIIMVLVPVGVFTRGDPHNLLPILGVSPKGMALAVIRAGYDYFGIEVIFLLYPYLKNKGELLNAGLKAAATCVGIYTWFTFTTIYYFGIDIMPKYLWVVVETSKAFRMMTIKNFTFIFTFFWILIALCNISNNYFLVTLVLNDIWGRLDMKKYTIIIAPIIFYGALKFGNETEIRAITINIVPLFTVYNIIYASSIALFIKLKGGQSK